MGLNVASFRQVSLEVPHHKTEVIISNHESKLRAVLELPSHTARNPEERK
jgi:hypothetical protein